jgi:transcription initiation factor TFIIB
MSAPRELSPGEVAEASAQTKKEAEWAQNLNIHLICSECKEFPPNLVEEFSAGDTVCGTCGLVLTQHGIDTRSEWRTFSNDDQGNDDPSRVGDAANPLLNGSQLTTTIAFGNGDARSRDLNRVQTKTNADKSTKTLLAAYKQISTFCNAFNIANIVAETAQGLYKIVDDAKAFKGKGQDQIIASVIFIACRQNNVPRTFKEITALTKVPKKEIGRTFKALEKFFMKYSGVVMANDAYTTTTSSAGQDFCARFSGALNLSPQIGIMSGDLAGILLAQGSLAGRSPLSIAAVAIYMMSHLMGFPKSAKDISKACEVSDGTVRGAYKTVYPIRETLIKQEWLDKGGKLENLPGL